MDIITPQPIESRVDNSQPTGSLGFTEDPAVSVLRGYFQEDNPTALKFIADYFNNNGTLTSTQMLLTLRDIEYRMGMAPLGKSRVARMYEYLKILGHMGELEQLKKSYER